MIRKTATLSRLGAHWVMDKVEPHVAILLKQVFPRIPKVGTGPFLFPNDPPTCWNLAWFCIRHPMVISDADSRALVKGRRAYEHTRDQLDVILAPDYQPGTSFPGLRDGQVVRPYQAQAVEIVMRRRGLLLGDAIGLGKTYTAAAMCLMSEARPAAIVVEGHVQSQWAEKLTAFTTLTVHCIHTTRPYSLPKADVYIFRYSQLAGWVDTFATAGFRSVTWDEIQQLRTGTASDKGSAAKKLTESTIYRLGLSATPIFNYGSEIWNIYSCGIDGSVLGGNDDFTREWCVSGDTRRVKDPESLGTFLRQEHVFLRRTKKEVGQQTPPINRIVENVESDPNAIKSIYDVAHALALRATSAPTFEERGRAGLELDLLVRQATGVGKARHVAAYVRLLLESQVPVVLAAWHREVYARYLSELAGFKPVMYTGSETTTQKDASVQSFLSGKTDLFIISLRSGAGLDGLQNRCSTVVFGELDHSPQVHEQVIGRLDREGQTEPVTAIYLNSQNGSDPVMIDRLGVKASQSTGIVDPGRVFEQVHSDTSRIQALAQQFLRGRLKLAA